LEEIFLQLTGGEKAPKPEEPASPAEAVVQRENQ